MRFSLSVLHEALKMTEYDCNFTKNSKNIHIQTVFEIPFNWQYSNVMAGFKYSCTTTSL